MKRILTILAVLASLTTGFAQADSLKIMSWNIANLASNPGEALRGHSRTQQQYQILQQYIADYDPDILALQEMGSKKAVERLVSDQYHIAMETRCTENEKSCSADVDDIYTAIAFKKSIASLDDVFQIDKLAVPHRNECCNKPRKVRGGVGVKVSINDKPTRITSLHIKATCKDDKIEPNTYDDCSTQLEQIDNLNKWIKTVPEGEAVILAGDFNRKLLNKSDTIRNRLLAVGNPQILPDQNRSCWSDNPPDWKALKQEAIDTHEEFDGVNTTPRIYSPKSNAEIDFFLVYEMDGTPLASEQVSMKAHQSLTNPSSPLTACSGDVVYLGDSKLAFSFGKANPSDHCPITLQVK